MSLVGRNVKVKPTDSICGPPEYVDRYMKDDWLVPELKQSQDVRDWIADPSQIDIFSNFFDLAGRVDDLGVVTKERVSVLDIGCHGGYLYDFLMDNCISEIEYTGVDVNRESVQEARDLHTDHPKFLVGDLFHLEEIPRHDIVVCSRLLIHAPFFGMAMAQLASRALWYVFTTLKIAASSGCSAFLETDLDTGRQTRYYIRVMTMSYVRQVATEMGLDVDVVGSTKRPYYSIGFIK